jgi:hypothetical protein
MATATLPFGATSDRRKHPTLDFSDPQLVDHIITIAYQHNQLSELKRFCKELSEKLGGT